MTTNANNLRCPLCGNAAEILSEAHPGYAEPSEFAIAECCYCDVQFCEPRTADSKVYENIYSSAATLPGYSRYAWYAREVKRRSDPLGWLRKQEAMYAFIASELNARGGPTKFKSVVEIGSGLGYLTFALHKAGYDVRGFELSQAAVDTASSRFGDLYQACDVTQLQGSVKADALIMTEVIEHVSDPCELLKAIHGMLQPGGIALITTPNKSAAPKSAYWATDNPPVHLWWFSETSMRRMAETAALRISFAPVASRVCRPAWPPYFDATGRQTSPSALVRTLLRSAPVTMLRLIAVLRGYRQRATQRGALRETPPTMCAVLQKRDS